ncbi:MAG: hypothetical protein AAFV78_11695, partial [Bacteroidota bacterium]
NLFPEVRTVRNELFWVMGWIGGAFVCVMIECGVVFGAGFKDLQDGGWGELNLFPEVRTVRNELFWVMEWIGGAFGCVLIEWGVVFGAGFKDLQDGGLGRVEPFPRSKNGAKRVVLGNGVDRWSICLCPD